MLLDLNLPRRNGLEVLAEVRADAEIASIPIVMLTTSGRYLPLARLPGAPAN